MAADSDGIRDVDLDRVIKAVEGAKCRRALGALALDVLSRQAEGRTLFAGEAFVEKRAAAHEVARKEADTAAGNLVGVLERGAKQPLERALGVVLSPDPGERGVWDLSPGDRR